MIPDRSSVDVFGDIYPPNNRAARRSEDWEMGGIGLQNPSHGLRVQEWMAWWDEPTGNVYLTADNQPAPTLLFIEPELDWLTIAFDQNMRWMSAYTLSDGQSYLKWYHSLIADYETRPLSSGVMTPFLTMDDNRDLQVLSGVSDVILTYLRAGSLWVRVQRERFLVERLISADIGESSRIWHFGMTDKLRLQWELR